MLYILAFIVLAGTHGAAAYYGYKKGSSVASAVAAAKTAVADVKKAV